MKVLAWVLGGRCCGGDGAGGATSVILRASASCLGRGEVRVRLAR